MAKKLLFALFVVVFGAFAGAFAWAFFWLMNTGIGLLWETAPAFLTQWGLPAVFYPIAFCTLGGLVIGLFTKKYGAYPADMNSVMSEVKSSGRYEYDHLGASFFGALLPLLFGGSIGPEAGLTGVIAGLCTWVGDRLRFVGAEMRELAEAGTAAVISAIFATPLFGLAVPLVGAADDSDGQRFVSDIRLGASKPLKTVIYVLAAASALATLLGLNTLVGSNGGLLHFSGIHYGVREFLWVLPLIAIGSVAGWLYHPFGCFANSVSSKLGSHVVIKPMLAGLILGCFGVLLPFTMFAGEAQSEIVAQSWTTLGAGVLIATGFCKVFTTQLCLSLGWRGGHFFPIIFAGIALGYGMALLTGADSIFCLCAVTGALVGSVMRQPVMTMLLLFLVFPVKAAPLLLVAAAVGSVLPVPQSKS